MTSAVGAGAAWAVSNTGAVPPLASVSGALSAAEGEVWTGLAAAVLIASALAETGAPVWVPVLKLCARSVGERLAGAWGAVGLIAVGARPVVGASMVGLELVAAMEVFAEGVTEAAFPKSPLPKPDDPPADVARFVVAMSVTFAVFAGVGILVAVAGAVVATSVAVSLVAGPGALGAVEAPVVETAALSAVLVSAAGMASGDLAPELTGFAESAPPVVATFVKPRVADVPSPPSAFFEPEAPVDAAESELMSTS